MSPVRVLDRLTPQDLLMVWPEDFGWPEYIGALGVLDGAGLLDGAGRLPLDPILSWLEPKLDLLPRLRQLLCRPGPGLGWPLWVDAPSFDLRDHVRVHPVAPPGGDAELLAACAGLLARRLDAGRPRWEMWLLPGVSGDRVGLFVKLHHAVADGVAGVATLAALLDVSPDPLAVPTRRSWTPTPAPSAGELLADNLRGRARRLRRVPSRVARTAKTVRAFQRTPQWREFPRPTPAPRTSLNRPIGPRRRLVVIRGRLEPVRRAAHANGATVNDTVLAAVAAGLGDLLRFRGEDVAGLVLRGLVPVSLHGTMPERTTGNQDAMMIVSLPVGEVDPVRALRLVAQDTAVRKSQAHPSTGTGLLSWPSVQRLSTRVLRRQRFVNVSITNVPGPPAQLYLAGARLLDLFPVAPVIGNLPLAVAVLSYAGQLNVTLVADPDACPDVAVFADGVRRGLRELADRSTGPDEPLRARSGRTCGASQAGERAAGPPTTVAAGRGAGALPLP